MVAGALRILGVDMGERQGHGNNEDLDIQDARGPAGELSDPAGDALVSALERMIPIIESRAKVETSWGWKDPHGVYYAPQIEPLLPDPRIIVAFRDPLAAAQRVHMLTGLPLLEALEDTLNLYQRCQRYLAETRLPAAIVSYEKSLVRPERFIDKLIAFCGLDPSDAAIEEAVAFCYPERGHGSPKDPGWPRQGAL